MGKPTVFGRHTVNEAFDPPQFLWPVNSSVGDARKALAAAAVKIEQTYTTVRSSSQSDGAPCDDGGLGGRRHADAL